MLTEIIAAFLNMLPAQVCGTQDLVTEVLITTNAGCPAPTEHLCWAGEWPGITGGTACCTPDGICRVEPGKSCLPDERAICGLHAPMACATDDLEHVYIEVGGLCESGHNFACWGGQYGESTWSVCCDGFDCEAIWHGDPCDGEVYCDAAPAP